MNYKRKLAGVVAASLLGAIGLAACDSNNPDAYGTVQVKLTDAPIDDFSEANITITRIVLVGDDEAELGATEDYVLYEGSFTANLLDLQNGIDTMLVRDEVPVGAYKQLRVVVDEPGLKIGGFQRVSSIQASADISADSSVRPGDYQVRIRSGRLGIVPETGDIIRILPAD